MHAHKAALITRQGGSISSRYFNKNQCTNELFFLVLERPQQTRLHLLNTEFQVNIQVFPTSCKGQTFQANWFGATRDTSTLYIIYTIISGASPVWNLHFIFLFKNAPTTLYLCRDKTKRQFGKNTIVTPTKILPKK